MTRIVIIGTGMAGYGLAREIRKLDTDVSLTLISADAGDAYSKPMLSNAVSKGKTPETLITADATAMAQQLSAKIITQAKVERIDRAQKTVVLAEQVIVYDTLVLAVGADPIRLPLNGNAVDRIISVNDIYDYARFRESLPAKGRLAIIGGGLIGCEFANDLAAEHKVHVIDRNPLPLGRLLHTAIATPLLDALSSLGIQWHGNAAIDSVDHHGDGVQIRLNGDEVIECDAVLSAVGLKARTALAQAAGLTTNRGIVVDRYLQSTDPHIYALGDCAEVEGQFLPFVMPLMRCTKALAATLCGELTAVNYPAMPVTLKTPVYPVAVMPPANDCGDWHIDNTEDCLRALHYNNGKLTGFAIGGTKAVQQANILAKELAALF